MKKESTELEWRNARIFHWKLPWKLTGWIVFHGGNDQGWLRRGGWLGFGCFLCFLIRVSENFDVVLRGVGWFGCWLWMGGEEAKTGRIIIEEKRGRRGEWVGVFRTKDQVFRVCKDNFLDTEEEDRAAWVKHWKGLSSWLNLICLIYPNLNLKEWIQNSICITISTKSLTFFLSIPTFWN